VLNLNVLEHVLEQADFFQIWSTSTCG